MACTTCPAVTPGPFPWSCYLFFFLRLPFDCLYPFLALNCVYMIFVQSPLFFICLFLIGNLALQLSSIFESEGILYGVEALASFLFF